MLKELLKIHQDSLVNKEAPECLFAETLVMGQPHVAEAKRSMEEDL